MADQLHIRLARAEDKADVIEFTKTIWGGQDYLPQSWDQWLNDPQGPLFVGEFEGKVVATAKLTALTPAYVWLEGLRVDPDYQGRGFGQQVHDFSVKAGLALPGVQQVGLSTAGDNLSVHRMARACGMRQICIYRYVVRDAEESVGVLPLTLSMDDLPAVEALLQESPDLQETEGYITDGWQCRKLKDVAGLLAQGRFMGQRQGTGLEALILLADPNRQAPLWISLCAGSTQGVTTLARGLCRMAVQRPFPMVRTMVPASSQMIGALLDAGFHDEPEEGEFFMYHFETPLHAETE